jgi:hypothetical protein
VLSLFYPPDNLSVGKNLCPYLRSTDIRGYQANPTPVTYGLYTINAERVEALCTLPTAADQGRALVDAGKGTHGGDRMGATQGRAHTAANRERCILVLERHEEPAAL